MNIKSYISSSVGKKQIVAISGLGLVLFLIGHLSGNLLIFKGPNAFNTYAATLKSLGLLLWGIRLGLIALFVSHIWFTILLILENKSARGQEYLVTKDLPGRSFATKAMKYTGPLVAFFLLIHLFDYTWPSPFCRSTISMGLELGLYGIVMNSFQNVLRVILYVAAMISIGFHLSHGIQSTAQTLGVVATRKSLIIKRISIGLGTIIAVGFSTIPIYLYAFQYMPGPQREFYQKHSHLAVDQDTLNQEIPVQPISEENTPENLELPPEEPVVPTVSVPVVPTAQPRYKKPVRIQPKPEAVVTPSAAPQQGDL
jgi:succinate dehydrogenase / fumarate reductase cytochrome b subunit